MTTLPTRPPDYLSVGPIDSADLAALLGYFGKKGVVAIWNPVEPPAAKLRIGACLGFGETLWDGQPFENRIRSCRVGDAGAGSYTDQDFPIPRPGSSVWFLWDSGGHPSDPGTYTVSWNPVASPDYTVEVQNRGATGPQPYGAIANGGTFTIKEGHRSGVQVYIHAKPGASGVPIDYLYVGRVTNSNFRPEWGDGFKFASVLRCLSWLPLFNGGSGHRGTVTPAAPHDWDRVIESGNVDPQAILALCDITEKHPWVCVPDGQTADYYRAFAARTDGESLTVEYSNEWTFEAVNSDAYHRIHERAKASGSFTAAQLSSGEARIRQGAREALAMVKAMREVNPKIKLALSTFTRDTRITRWQLEEAKAAGMLDAIRCVAPSFYWYQDAYLATIISDDIATRAFGSGVAATLAYLKDHAAIAREFSVPVWCYEGGPHTLSGWQSRPDYKWVHAYIHDDARVADHARKMFQGLAEMGVEVACWMGGWASPEVNGTDQWFSSRGPNDLGNPRIASLSADYPLAAGGGA